MTPQELPLLSIGEVARRVGLSVSAVRYYSDEGLVRAAEVTDAGHRRYDVEQVARLELVRTLRDLDAGLDSIRAVLDGTTSLRELLAAHLEIVERHASELAAKRAVLRALVRENGTAERASLLRKLAAMPDTERQRMIDDFWNEVAAGLPDEVRDRIEGERPQLPGDPTPEQLDAWIALAELVRDADFRTAVRENIHDTYRAGAGAEMAAPRVQEFIGTDGAELTELLLAAHRSGAAPDAPEVARLAARFVAQTAAATGLEVDDALRQRMAEGYRRLASVTRDSFGDADYTATHGRYLELVAIINGRPHPDAELLAAADGAGPLDLGDFGGWLARAILAD